MAPRQPTPSAMSIALPGGRELDMAIRMPSDAQQFTVRPVRSIAPHRFEACPICGNPATTSEHVPPAAMGGVVMTRTCEPCNHRLGSHVEPDLIDWVDGALTLTAFAGDAVVGPRYARRLLHRTTAAGEFVLVIDGKHDEAIRDLLASGTAQLSASFPDENRMRIAAMKHAYLSACLYLRSVPPHSDQMRRDLLAARDAQRRDAVPYSPVAAGLTVLRLDPDSGTLPSGPLVYAIAQIDGQSVPGVLLGGATFVSWAGDLKPASTITHPNRMTATLDVGAALSGTITSVTPDIGASST
ncbi:MAG: HNH endonuclease [Microthrixaceae bacterium]